MAYTKTIELPQTVQPRQLRIDVAAEIRQGIESLKAAVAKIWEIEDLPRVNSIEDMAADWVQSITAEGITATKNDKSLTASARSARLQEWRKIERNGITLTTTVQNVVKAFPEIVWCYNPDNGDVSVSQSNIDKVIEQRSTVDVPQLAQDHWDKLQSIIAEIRDLRAWEQENNIMPFPIRMAVNCLPSSFAETWASKDNVVDHKFDRYRVSGNSNDLII